MRPARLTRLSPGIRPSLASFGKRGTWSTITFIGDSTDETARTYGAIQGSLRALDDPYTRLYRAPAARPRRGSSCAAVLAALAPLLSERDDGRILLTPMEDRPAAKAGILEGDELMAVDGSPDYAEMPFDDVLALVRGEVGDVVRLTVRREGSAEPLDFGGQARRDRHAFCLLGIAARRHGLYQAVDLWRAHQRRTRRGHW